jgi:1L-myo-inositol 1-phosphate cytidylyltransferase
MVSEAVVLLAGAGSRLNGTVPKPLVEICGAPLISYVLDGLESIGVRTVHAVVGANAAAVVAGLEHCRPRALTLNVIHNSQWQKQNGISVLCAARAVEAPFLLTMGDHLFDPTILSRLLEGADHSCLNVAVDQKIETIFDIDDAMKVQTKNGRIVAIGKALTKYDAIDTGIFLCPNELFDYLRRAKQNGDCSLADGVRLMAKKNKVKAVDIGDAWWQDVDTPEMLARAEEDLRGVPKLKPAELSLRS